MVCELFVDYVINVCVMLFVEFEVVYWDMKGDVVNLVDCFDVLLVVVMWCMVFLLKFVLE